MNTQRVWRKTLNKGFFHEKAVFFSLLFLLTILIFDCIFQNLPLSGYGLVLVTLIVIGFTTWATCHGIKWAITSNKPLQTHMIENKYEKTLKFISKPDNIVIKLFHSDLKFFESLKYLTNFNEQIRLLLKDIEREFIKAWYTEISQNPLFLFDSHLILEEIVFKIIKKLKTINIKSFISSILLLYLSHLQEYKKAVKKLTKLKLDGGDNNEKIVISDVWRYSHPCSQSDQILNYYLKKVTKVIFKEFAPYEFSNSLECKVISGIIGKKILKKFLLTLEDPTWINLKLIFLLNAQMHDEILKGKSYSVKEKVLVAEETEFQFKTPRFLGKRYFSSNLFESSKNLFEKNEVTDKKDYKAAPNSCTNSPVKTYEKKNMTLPLSSSKIDDPKGSISTVLSGLISSTAGPLLPDNISVHYQALNKMWQSPVAEVKDISESITNSFRKVFMNGVKEKKGLGRSKSTESLSIPGESGLRVRDISVGEELSESMALSSSVEEAGSPKSKSIKKLTKTHSFDNDSLMTSDEPEGENLKSDEKEKDPTSEQQRDVSPVYEEPEDFATTIAKLRSLLQQRESSSTLSGKSNLSMDSAEKSQSSNKSQSLEGDSFDSQTACEIPTDGRLFINIFIPKAELVSELGSTHVVYTIQYDGIYLLKQEQPSSDSEPELVLQTTVITKKFLDFLHLQTKLEENGNFRAFMKGIKGPSKWMNLQSSGKTEDSSRKSMLETFLRQICSNVEISNSAELHEFLGYGQSGNDTLAKKDSQPSIQRIDKLLADKVTGVFNSIKTVLPSFDFDSPVFLATNEPAKTAQDQKLLQNFLNFGNKPESFELNLNCIPKEPTGESLSDDIRHYFSRKSDCIEDAVDVLDSSDWLSEQKECRFISPEDACVWQSYKESLQDDELETLDSFMPIYSLIIDIISELLQDSDSWVVKEPVIRLIKVLSGHWELKLEEECSKLDWDKIFGNIVRLFRLAVFQTSPKESIEIELDKTKAALEKEILNLMSGWVNEIVKPSGLESAVSFFLDSFQHFRLNRDTILRLLDIFLVNLLSCHHLVKNSP